MLRGRKVEERESAEWLASVCDWGKAGGHVAGVARRGQARARYELIRGHINRTAFDPKKSTFETFKYDLGLYMCITRKQK